MKNKTVLITGSTDGIGVQTALELAKKGARILIHGRNPDRAAKVVSQIESAGGQAQSLIADLSSMADVKKLAAAANAAGPIHVLINNAGVFMKEKKLTVDGFETTFAVNHLAVFLLTNELLPSMPDGSRIITLSSIAHKNGKIDFDNLQSEKSFDGYAAYAMSKLCNVVFSYELARRAASRGILSNAVHPGVIQTKLLKEGFNMDSAGSLEEGAATSIYLASASEVQGVTGKYFVSSRESVSSSASRDEALQRKLWDVSEQLLSRF